MDQVMDPCKSQMRGMCPMTEGVIDLESSIPDISPDVINNIPGVFGDILILGLSIECNEN